MKKIFIIRHAESKNNAGGYTEDTFTVKLSEKGEREARVLADTLEKPDKIFVSKYQRTRDTALPFLNKYKSLKIEIWDSIHEFEPHDKSELKNI